jgi:hypothetical protein
MVGYECANSRQHITCTRVPLPISCPPPTFSTSPSCWTVPRQQGTKGDFVALNGRPAENHPALPETNHTFGLMQSHRGPSCLVCLDRLASESHALCHSLSRMHLWLAREGLRRYQGYATWNVEGLRLCGRQEIFEQPSCYQPKRGAVLQCRVHDYVHSACLSAQYPPSADALPPPSVFVHRFSFKRPLPFSSTCPLYSFGYALCN